jgi:hypothetical protein
MRSKNSKRARLACILLSLVAIIGVAVVAHGALFDRCRSHDWPPCGAAVQCCPSSAVAAAAVVKPNYEEQCSLPWEAKPAPSTNAKCADRPCLLPWNCPNGKCHPKEEINVNVVAPGQPAGVAPVNVSVEQPAPPDAPFPWGILLAVLVPVVIVASVIAFVIRIATSRG